MSITIALDSLERIEPENRHEIPLYRLVFKTKGRIDEFEFPILVPRKNSEKKMRFGSQRATSRIRYLISQN